MSATPGLLARLRQRLATWIAPSAEPQAPRGKLRRAARGSAATLLGLCVLLGLVRVAIPFVLPSVLSKVGRSIGLALTYERLDLALLSGEVRIDHLEARPLEGGEPLAAVHHVLLHVEWSGLLGGRFVVRRADVDGIDVDLLREADGSLAIVNRILAALGPRPPRAPEPESGPPFDVLRFLERWKVEALRLQRVHARIRDASVTPPVDLHAFLDVRVSNWDLLPPAEARPCRVEVLLRGRPLLGSLALDGTIRGGGRNLSAALDMALDQLRPSEARGWLALLGMRPAAESLDLTATLRARPHAGQAGPGSAPGWDLVLERLRADADGEEAVAIDRASCEMAALEPGLLEVSRAGADGVRARAVRRSDGALRVLGLDVLPRPRSRGAVAVQASTAGTPTPASGPPPGTTGQAKPLRIVIRQAGLTAIRGALRDEAVEPPADLAAIVDTLQLRDLVLDDAAPSTPAPIRLEARLPGLLERLTATGTASVTGGETALDVAVDGRGVDPRALAAHLRDAGLRSTLRQGRLGLHLAARLFTPKDAEGGLAIDGAARDLVFADGEEELLGLESVRTRVTLRPQAQRIDLAELELRRPRTHARRDAEGVVHALGFETLRGAPPPAPVAEGGTSPGLDAEAAPRAKGPPLTLALARLRLTEGAVRFTDEAVRPTASATIADLVLEVDGVETTLGAKAPRPAPARLRLAFAAPGLVDGVELRGSFVPSPEEPALDLTCKAEGIEGRAADGWLTRAGLARELGEGTLEVALAARAGLPEDGPVTADASITRLVFAAGERDLVRLEGLAAKGFRLDAAAGGRPGRLSLERFSLGRLWLGAGLDASGRPGALGLRLLAPGTPASAPPADALSRPALPAEVPPSGPALAFDLGEVEVGEIALDVEDRRHAPPLFVPFRLELRARDLAFDPGRADLPPPASLTARLSVPGALESLVLRGEGAIGRGRGRVAARLEALGISLASIAPALAPLGVAPALQDGRFTLSLRGEGAIEEDRFAAEAALEDVSLVDGDVEWLGLGAARVVGLRREASRLALDEVRVERPRALLRREAGALSLAGVRLAAASPTTPTPGVEPVTVTSVAARASVLEVKALRVEDVGIRVVDRTGGPDRAVSVSMGAEVRDVVLGRRAPPARFAIAAAVPGAVDRLTIEGTASLDPEAPALGATIALDGLRAGPLGSFLPPGLAIATRDGRLDATLSAQGGASAAGGRRAEVSLTGLRLSERGAQPLLAVEAIRLRAGRIDPEGGVVAIDEAVIAGIEGRATRRRDGSTLVAGLRLGGEVATEGQAARPTAGSQGATPPAPPPDAPPPEKHQAPPPLVSCERFSIEVRRFEVLDETGDVPAEPLTVRGLELKNTDPVRLLGRDPSSQPYVALELAGEVAPLVKLVTATARLSPFAIEPEFSVRASVTGVRGEALPRVLPALAGRIDGRELTEGRGHIQIVLRGRTRRRDPLDFSFLAKGFGGEASVRRTWFRNGDGPILAGIQDFRVDVHRFDPATGEVRIREVEVGKPTLRATKDARGTRILDLVFLEAATGTAGVAAPPPGGGPSAPRAATRTAYSTAPGGRPPSEVAKGGGAAPPSAQKDVAANPPRPAPPRPTEKAPARAPAPLVIERVSANDVDLLFQDLSVDPPFVLPLTGLEVEAGPIATGPGAERVTTRFEAAVRTGNVKLPKRTAESFVPGLDMMTDMLGKVAEATGALDAKKREYETRPLAQEIGVKGDLVALPAGPSGTINATLHGLELGNVAGLAKKSGVNLADGLLDVDLKLRLPPEGGLRMKADVLLTALDLAEPPDGPIASTLGLPAPLNAVLFALRNEEGEIGIPIRVELEPGEVSGAALSGAIARAVATIAGKALANIGFRVGGQVVDTLKGVANLVPGVNAIPFLGEAANATFTPVVVSFAPGEPLPLPSECDKVAEMIAAARSTDTIVLTLEHAIGGGDYARSRIRANPTPEDRRDLVARLEGRRRDGEARRADLVAEARAALQAGLPQEAEAVAARIREVDRELVEAEGALEKIYDLERGGADRQAGRRGRLASLALAQARLEAVRLALLARGMPGEVGRIILARPRIEDAPGTAGGTVTVTVVRKKKR